MERNFTKHVERERQTETETERERKKKKYESTLTRAFLDSGYSAAEIFIVRVWS